MRLAALALALLALQTSAGECVRSGARCQNDRSGRGGARPSFTLFTEYDFGNPGVLPSSSFSTTHLVALCKVNAGGTAWECVDKNGAAFGTVTQGTGTTYQQTPFGMYAMADLTSAKTPHLVSTAIDSIWKSDHTVVMAGYGTTLTDSSYQHWFGFNDGTNGVYARNESGALYCAWGGSGGTISAFNGPAAAVDGWAVVSCRRSGTNYYSRVNGTDSVAASAASTIAGDVAAGTGYYMGDRQSAGLPLRGPLAWVAFYDSALTSAQIKTIENAWWGLDTRTTTATNGTGLFCFDPDGGQNDCYFGGAMLVGPRGLRGETEDQATSAWAADSLSATGGVSVGTPTITANASAGPFYRWHGGAANDCALVVDDDAAAFEGKQSGNAYTSIQGHRPYTASFYMAAGDAGTTVTKARIKFDVTGGGWIDAGTTHTCDITGMTYAVTRQTCTTPEFYADAGSPTVKASYLVGNATSDTGSVTVCHRQVNQGTFANVPVLDNVLKGSSSISLSPTTDSWPTTTSGGKYEIVFTPLYDPLNDWHSADDVLYLFDSHDATPEHGVITLFGYTVAGRTLIRTESSGSQTEFQLDGQALTSGTMYAVAVEWRPEGGGTCSVKWRLDSCPSGITASCTATTLMGSATGGVCPAQPTEARILNRYDNSNPTDGFVSAVRVYRL